MNKILSLQSLQAVNPVSTGDSTSSHDGCVCSTNSFTGCPATEEIFAF